MNSHQQGKKYLYIIIIYIKNCSAGFVGQIGSALPWEAQRNTRYVVTRKKTSMTALYRCQLVTRFAWPWCETSLQKTTPSVLSDKLKKVKFV